MWWRGRSSPVRRPAFFFHSKVISSCCMLFESLRAPPVTVDDSNCGPVVLRHLHIDGNKICSGHVPRSLCGGSWSTRHAKGPMDEGREDIDGLDLWLQWRPWFASPLGLRSLRWCSGGSRTWRLLLDLRSGGRSDDGDLGWARCTRRWWEMATSRSSATVLGMTKNYGMNGDGSPMCFWAHLWGRVRRRAEKE